MASMSVLVPAYNEEKHLRNTVDNLKSILKEYFDDYEIIIVDDCSTDSTQQISKMLEKGANIKVVRNSVNKGLGYNYRKGIKIASKEYFTWIPGDDDVDHDSIRNAFQQVGAVDLVVPYICNQHERPVLRRLMSRSYVMLLNLLFNLKMRYFNGFIICRTSFLKDVKITTDSFAFQSEALIRLLKKGLSYVEVPYKTIPQRETSIFKAGNLWGVFTTVCRLLVDIHLKRDVYSKSR